MNTKKKTPIQGNSRTRKGRVKVINAVASIHKILDEIAPEGSIHCDMTTTDRDARFLFTHKGIRASFVIEKGGSL